MVSVTIVVDGQRLGGAPGAARVCSSAVRVNLRPTQAQGRIPQPSTPRGYRVHRGAMSERLVSADDRSRFLYAIEARLAYFVVRGGNVKQGTPNYSTRPC